MTYVIHGATGAQGAPVVARLAKAGKKVIAAIRNRAAVTDAPAVAVDYSSVDSLASAYRDADGVFVHLPVASRADQARYARNIAEAIGRARPRRVVISTSGVIIDQPDSPLQAPDDSPIRGLLRDVDEASVSVAVVAPRFYLENLLLPFVFGAAKSQGVLRYPLRADLPVSWSSHLDVAEVATKLLTDLSITGIVGVGQHPPITGIQLAEGFTRHLGRTVTFESVAPEAFGESLTPLFGAGAAADVVAIYKAFARTSVNAITSSTSAQQLLGLTPRTVQQWLTELGV